MSSKLHQLVLQLFIQSWRTLANYAVKAGVVCLQSKLCDPHLSALGEVLTTMRYINLRNRYLTFTIIIPTTYTFYPFIRLCNQCHWKSVLSDCKLHSDFVEKITLPISDIRNSDRSISWEVADWNVLLGFSLYPMVFTSASDVAEVPGTVMRGVCVCVSVCYSSMYISQNVIDGFEP